MAIHPDQSGGLSHFPREKILVSRSERRRGRLADLSVNPATRKTITNPFQEAQAGRVPPANQVVDKLRLFSAVPDFENFDQTADPLEVIMDFVADNQDVHTAEKIQLGVLIANGSVRVPAIWQPEDLAYISRSRDLAGGGSSKTFGDVESWVLLTTRIPSLQEMVRTGKFTPEQAATELDMFDRTELTPRIDPYSPEYLSSASRVSDILHSSGETIISEEGRKLIETMTSKPAALFETK